jgi:hypothetical protein
VGLALAALLTLALASVAALLLADRAGLGAEYFALGAPWSGRPITRMVGEPRLDHVADIHKVLSTDVVFSVRWRGWWDVREGGEHSFAVEADDGGYLRIDGILRADSAGIFGEPPSPSGSQLAAGFHAIEIGLFQTIGNSHLAVGVAGPGAGGAKLESLELADLYSGRPLVLRRWLRRSLTGWSTVARQLLGAALAVAAAFLAGWLGVTTGAAAELARHGRRLAAARATRPLLLLALVVATFLLTFPYTGTVRGGDDAAYLAAAHFAHESWFFNRYVHVYLLRLAMALCGGDPLLATRVWWSFVFSATVGSLAVAIRAVGPGLQLRTLAVTLFVLLAQTTLLGTIGAAFADFSAMMFVTAAVAVYLDGLAREAGPAPPRRPWHALALGALTVAATRSKEVGAILLLLPLLFLIRDSGPDWRRIKWRRIEWRRFGRKMAYWAAGVLAVLSILIVLDGLLLGDAFYMFDSQRYAASGHMNFPEELAPRGSGESWLEVIWEPKLHPGTLSLRNLWIAVVAAAMAAGLRRRRLEVRLLHLLPVAYLLALMVLYIRLPHPFSSRMLIPILPVACLMTGLLLRDAGIEELSWRELLRPVVSLPVAGAAALLFLVVVPYRLGALDATDFLPVATLGRYGWSPDLFAAGVLLPILLLALLGGLSLLVAGRSARVAALLVAFLAFFGLGLETNRESLVRGWARQRGDLLVYPWRSFHDELEAARPRTIAFSRDLHGHFKMAAGSHMALASLMLDRRDFKLRLVRDLPRGSDVAIASPLAYRAWLREAPALAESAKLGPAGAMVLVYPKEALETARGERQERRRSSKKPKPSAPRGRMP